MKSSRISEETQILLRQYSQSRLESLRNYRISWWAYWADLASMYLPHRYRWFTTPNKYSRGSPRNAKIVDETGLLAARVLAAGLLSGLTSPTKPWFRFGLRGVDDIPEGPEKEWLSDVTKLILEIYAGSNFYETLGQAYYDLVVFGTAPMYQFEDPNDVVRFYGPQCGEYFLGVSNRNVVDSIYREYTYTIKQTVEEFGLENCSVQVKTMWTSGGSARDTEIVIAHSIEPNEEIFVGGALIPAVVPPAFRFRETYWEQGFQGAAAGNVLRCSGYKEDPFTALRWDVTANDAYGRGPGMYGLPAVLQLQVMTLRMNEAVDKLVRPPMVGSVSMKNEPTNILPAGITYVADMQGAGFKPAFTVDPRLQEMGGVIEQVQGRVKSIFYNDLFLGISQLGTVRTATEVEARKEEIVVQIGPVIERTENEGLAKSIARTFAIAKRKGLLPPMPDSLKGSVLNIRYISLLSETQRAARLTGMERTYSFAGSIAALVPDIMDNLDTDKALLEYADGLDVDPELLRSPDAIAAIRAKRQEAQQAAAALQTGTAAAQGAETLSNTDVGGGQNALQMMLGRQAA